MAAPAAPKDFDVLSDAAVETLHARFMARAEEKAEAALALIDDVRDAAQQPRLRDIALDLVLHAARMRVKDYVPGVLAELVRLAANNNGDDKVLAQEKKRITSIAAIRETEASSTYGAAEVPSEMMAQFRAAAARRISDPRVEAAFQGRERIYISIKDDQSATYQQVQDALAHMPAARAGDPPGYRILDWSKGYATDHAGKQQFRIGALLRKHAPNLLRDFEHRTTDNLMVVISRKPEDIAMASTNRAWHSCAGATSFSRLHAFGKIGSGIEAGMMIAYLVTANDPDIINPLSRVMINPFVRARRKDAFDLSIASEVSRFFARLSGKLERPSGERVWYPDKVYGLANQHFRPLVADFVDAHFNTGAAGRFWLAQGVYHDATELVERRHEQTRREKTRYER